MLVLILHNPNAWHTDPTAVLPSTVCPSRIALLEKNILLLPVLDVPFFAATPSLYLKASKYWPLN